MLGNRNKKIKISKSELNKAIVKKNESLKANNANLKEINKGLEEEQSVIKKETTAAKRQKTKAIKELEVERKALIKVKDDIKDANKKVQDSRSKASKYEGLVNASILTLNKVKSDIKDSMHKVNLYNKVTEDYDTVVKSVKDNESTVKDLKKECSKLKSLKTRTKTHIDNYESVIEDKKDELVSLSTKVDEVKEEHKAMLDIMETETSKLLSERAKKIQELHETIVDKNLVMDEIKMITLKNKKALDRVNEDLHKQKKALKNEKDKIKKVQKAFEEWKISNLDEMARMKLRGRMENIDKAGLKDVLDSK